MDKINMLSGDQLVEKGKQKSNMKLPEIGSKEVFRNGSWLEQKQIQAALEARKDIIEVERIEKSGTLSQADWNEILGLAEVTHKTGGHWQYLGHSKGDKLYLYPEEALFLIEVNCLLLKHNNVVMSLQEAYSLLLVSSVELMHYKVYSSLSRLGYKVFRHTENTPNISKDTELTEYEKNINLPPIAIGSWVENNPITEIHFNESEMETNNSDTKQLEASEYAMDIDNKISKFSNQNELNTSKEVTKNGAEAEENGPVCDENTEEMCEENQHCVMELHSRETEISDVTEEDTNTYSNNECELIHHCKIMKLRNRQLTISKKDQKHFDNIPDLYQKRTVTIKAPAEQFIPKNVFLNLTDYVLNLDDINSKTIKSTQTRTNRTYSMADEVSGPHIRRINSSETTSTPIPQFFPSNPRFQNYNPQFRQFTFCRPRQNFNYYLFHLLLQRPYVPRFQIPPVPPLLYMRFQNPNNFNSRIGNHDDNNRKRTRDNLKLKHMKSIEDLVSRIKKLREAGNINEQNTAALKKLINTYNIRYETKLRLNKDFGLIDDSVVDTIDLDDDEQTPSKKPRRETNFNNFTENLNALRQLALKLKDLEEKRQTNHRHRRALINAIRTFNKSYNAEVFMNTNFEILDQRHITLASSSDSDCIIENSPKKAGKKFKNPFNILKRLSEKRNTTSLPTHSETNKSSTSKNTQYPSQLTEVFGKNWLPDFNDFGKAEVVAKNNFHDPVIAHINGEYLLEYLVSNPHKFENWLDLKLSFVESVNDSIHAASKAFKSKSITENNGISPIIKPEDCTDMRTVLEKLSIIKNCCTEGTTELRVDFDVYNRDVQNFRISNRPKPHFMLVCINESSNFPPGDEIAAFRAKYNNDATIMFAIVGIGSVQYLQIKPMNIPIYLSKETS